MTGAIGAALNARNFSSKLKPRFRNERDENSVLIIFGYIAIFIADFRHDLRFLSQNTD